jgi:hypothetical protein
MPSWGRLAIAIAVVGGFAFGGVTPSAEGADRRTVGMAIKVVSPAEVNNQPAAVGTLAHMNDELRTGAKARLQISFRDSSELTLGENAHVVVDRFIFDPDAGTGEALLKTGVGAFRLATGKISGLRDKKITVSTPFATLGVRGTDFWWGPIDGHFGVYVVADGPLRVSNKLGGVTLFEGYGTDIHSGVIGPPTKWEPGKVQRALNQTYVGPVINPGILAPGVIPLLVIPQLQSDPAPPLAPPQPRTPDGTPFN